MEEVKKLGRRRPHIRRSWSHVGGRTSRSGGVNHILGGVGQMAAGGKADFGAGGHTVIGACTILRNGALVRGKEITHQREDAPTFGRGSQSRGCRSKVWRRKGVTGGGDYAQGGLVM